MGQGQGAPAGAADGNLRERSGFLAVQLWGLTTRRRWLTDKVKEKETRSGGTHF